jgi:hypothetical protein
VLPCTNVTLTRYTWHTFSDQMLPVKKGVYKKQKWYSLTCGYLARLSSTLIFYSSGHPGPVGKWHTVGTWNRDMKNNFESDMETLTEGGKWDKMGRNQCRVQPFLSFMHHFLLWGGAQVSKQQLKDCLELICEYNPWLSFVSWGR